jgi:hypothetical protein
MKSSRSELFTLTSSAYGRREGIMVALIEWWVEYHLDQNELMKIADDCDFSSILVKRDDILGDIILKRKDFYKRFCDDVNRDPATALIMNLVMQPCLDPKMDPQLKKDTLFQINQYFRSRFAHTIGWQLIRNGWWKTNQSKINKERKNHKLVKKIHES